MNKDYYEILGIKKDATQQEIKSAYRKLVKKYHPDVSKEIDAEKRFAEISSAYEVLGDETKRKNYDQFGSSYNQQQSGFNGAQGYGGFSQQDYERFYQQYNQNTSGYQTYTTFSFSELFKLWWKNFLRKPFGSKIKSVLYFFIFLAIIVLLIILFIRYVLPLILIFIVIGILLKVLGSVVGGR